MMLRRDPELNFRWGTICTPVEMLAPDGTILARGLRGEEIEKKLAEIFSK